MNNSINISSRQPLSSLFYYILSGGQKLFKIFSVLFLLQIIKLFTKDGEGNGKRMLAIFIVYAIACIGYALFKYFSVRYYVDENYSLIINYKWINKKTITIPRVKIQNIQTKKSWQLHLFNLTSIKVDTPGKANEEAELVLRPKDVSEISEVLLGNKKAETEEQTTEVKQIEKSVLFKTSPKDVLKLGLSANHLETLFIVLAFLFSQYNDLKDLFAEAMENVSDSANSFFMQQAAAGFIVLSIVALILTVIISVIRVALKYFNFVIAKDELKYIIEYGFINTIKKQLVYKKIQFVQWHANALRNKLQLYELKLVATGDEQLKHDLKTNIPVTEKNFLYLISTPYYNLSEQNFVNDDTAVTIDKRYVWRKLVLIIMPITLAVIALAVLVDNSFYYILLPLVYLLCYYIAVQKNAFVKYNEDCVAIEKNSFGKNVSVIKWEKIQMVSMLQSLYQKKHNLFSIKLHLSGGTVVFPYITAEEAYKMYNLALYKMETNKWQ